MIHVHVHEQEVLLIFFYFDGVISEDRMPRRKNEKGSMKSNPSSQSSTYKNNSVDLWLFNLGTEPPSSLSFSRILFIIIENKRISIYLHECLKTSRPNPAVYLSLKMR